MCGNSEVTYNLYKPYKPYLIVKLNRKKNFYSISVILIEFSSNVGHFWETQYKGEVYNSANFHLFECSFIPRLVNAVTLSYIINIWFSGQMYKQAAARVRELVRARVRKPWGTLLTSLGKRTSDILANRKFSVPFSKEKARYRSKWNLPFRKG